MASFDLDRCSFFDTFCKVTAVTLCFVGASLGTYVQNVLLDDRVHYDTDQAVKEDGSPVFYPRVVQRKLPNVGGVVLERDKNRGDW